MEFFHLLENLKKTKRTGWIQNEIPNPESVSDHMYRMALMALFLSEDSDIDRDKCIKMCLVHDIGESKVGDITPNCGISSEEKFDMENNAMKEIRQMLPVAVGNEVFNLWMEYEQNETKEAKLVHQLDKFEMMIQAKEYERAHGKHLEQFYEPYYEKITNPILKKWLEEFMKE